MATEQRSFSVSIPEDIAVEILYRLPVKSTTRFKSLSKHYFSLIESPIVITKHLHFSSLNNPSLLLRRYFRPPITNTGISLLDRKTSVPTDLTHTPFACDLPNTKIVGSCNGILCVSLSPGDDNLLLWNPATRQLSHIPPPLITLVPPPVGTSLNRLSIGFGFDRDLSDLKVVRIVYFRKHSSSELITRVEIFARSVGFWREINVDDVTDINSVKICERCPLVNLNGVLYFETISVLEIENDRQFILQFDVHDETFKRIPLPSACDESLFWCLFVWKETLTVFVHRWGLNCALFEVWMMNESGGNGELWNKLFVIGSFDEISTPMEIWKNNEVVMQGEGAADDILVLHDLKSRETKNIRISGARFIYEAYNYVESMIPV